MYTEKQYIAITGQNYLGYREYVTDRCRIDKVARKIFKKIYGFDWIKTICLTKEEINLIECSSK